MALENGDESRSPARTKSTEDVLLNKNKLHVKIVVRQLTMTSNNVQCRIKTHLAIKDLVSKSRLFIDVLTARFPMY